MGNFATAVYRRFTGPLSAAGLILGALFWWASLTPSLIPRDGLLQGAIGGLCFSAGYALAVAIVAAFGSGRPCSRRRAVARSTAP